MIQGLLIAIIATTLAHDGMRGVPLFGELPHWVIVLGALGPLAVIALFSHAAVVIAGWELDRGRWRNGAIADHALSAGRTLAAVSHAVAVLGLGWLDLVREWLGGNWVLVDEAVVTLPPILILVGGWWSYYLIERRMREATLVRRLDDGQEQIERLPTRTEYVFEQVRHHVLLILLPITMIALWAESVDAFVGVSGPETDASGWWGSLGLGLHVLGVVGILVFMPMALRLIWDTVPLGAGPLRDRMMNLCAVEGVRCRELLVWRTRSGMLNGALVGFLPWMRYILLTDALLERLPAIEIEAVMAHELAHARRRHLPWLMVALLASVGWGWTVSWWIGVAILTSLGAAPEGGLESLLTLGALGGAVTMGLLAFGFVSRRFEQQADAFAAQHLSGWTRESRQRRDVRITPEAAGAMVGALGHVAVFNHVSPRKFSWRHGSIRSRQVRLAALPGRLAHQLPIDGGVRALKWVAALALVAAGLVLWGIPSLMPM